MRVSVFVLVRALCSEKEGSLYELDGRKSFPINHGPTTPETLLKVPCGLPPPPSSSASSSSTSSTCRHPISCPSGCLWMPVCVCGQDAVRVVGEFMARDEGEMRFTITALAPSVDEE